MLVVHPEIDHATIIPDIERRTEMYHTRNGGRNKPIKLQNQRKKVNLL